MRVKTPSSRISAFCKVIALLAMAVAATSSVRAEQLPVRTYTTADGLLRDQVNRIKQDSRGFLWFCTDDGLSRFDGYGFTNYTTDDGLPHRVVNDLLETRDGVLWIATNNGLARFNPKGQRAPLISAGNRQSALGNAQEPMFVTYSPEEAPSIKHITVLFEDAAGKLWCGTDDGLYWFQEQGLQAAFHPVDLPRERPGLRSEVSAIIQDRQGNLWVAADQQGLNRITLDGRVEHYPTRHERNRSESIVTLLETRDGRIPELDKPRQAPNVLLTGLRIAGEKRPVSELGEATLSELTLESSQRQVGVDFLGLGANLGEELRYQYKLEGAPGDWSEPTTQRAVDFANLAPGRYRLLVKAITAEGTESIKPAGFAITILPPIWQRWWFLTLAAIAVGLTAYALYRYRVARLVELERVRTRIATDLHDDIGANLSLIAMASEVVRMQSREDDAQTRESLSLISDTSRELVDAMGEIVWCGLAANSRSSPAMAAERR